MENLTIKELAALAANGTKVYVFDKHEFLQRYLEIAPNGNWAVELTLENCKEYVIKNGYKPILFSLSSLTKPITINGETFVPMDIIEINIRSGIDIYQYLQGDLEINIETENFSQTIDIMDGYKIIQKLLEWKFDIFNLIERGLAISVTETFNPYK